VIAVEPLPTCGIRFVPEDSSRLRRKHADHRSTAR
jgi:hypothetical protein